MQKILFEYNLDPTTWVYLSSLLTIGIFFKFRRFWSIRNIDLIGLIAFAPGLLLVSYQKEQLGYTWLFVVGGLFLVRLLSDSLMVRRPLLEPNLSVDGLTFTGVALLVFLTTNVITDKLTESDLEGARRIDQILARQADPAGQTDLARHGPGYPLFYVFATFSNKAFVPKDAEHPAPLPRRALVRAATTRTTAILAHLAIVIGIVLIGYRHFDNIQTGVAAAALYLLLPYTAQMTSRIDHVIPAALLVWAVEAYRRPMVAGMFLGFAAGVIYYPLFLLPLWCGFYWRRGLVRFLIGMAGALLLVVASLAFTSNNFAAFTDQLMQMFGARSLSLQPIAGFWRFHEPAYRIPVAAAFAVICCSMAIWPSHKNLGTLLSCSAAVMLGIQFWHDPQQGVYYMAWFLPLLLMTIFRPNLEDRVAITTVNESWFARGRTA